LSLRDHLREQAAQIEERDRELRQNELEQQQYFVQSILPVMKAAAIYFRDVVRDLEIVKPAIYPVYPIGPQAEREVVFTQSQYRVFVNDEHEPTQVSVNSTCEISAPTTRVVRELREADEFEQLLRDMGITYHRRRQEDYRGDGLDISRFIIEGSIQAGFRLSADIPGKRVRVETHNLEHTPNSAYMLKPERVNEELFDALGRVLLREQKQLLSTEVDDERRAQLRRDVVALQRQREIDLAYGLAEQEELARQKSLKGLQSGAKANFKVWRDQIVAAVKNRKDSD
jgi:hypothetical protein